MYIFDTSPLSNLFKNFYPRRFPTLWQNLDNLIEGGDLISTREVRRELALYARADEGWMSDSNHIFTTPTADEINMIRNIYAIPHFQQNIEMKKIQKGGLNADPFVIAKASVCNGTVVTLESSPPNGAKIPNICNHFSINCINLEQFMEKEGWEF